MAAPKKSAAKEQGNGASAPLEFTREQELNALRDMLQHRRPLSDLMRMTEIGLSAGEAEDDPIGRAAMHVLAGRVKWRAGDLPDALVFDLCLDPASGRLAAATYGRGMWELKAAPPCVADATTLCLNANRFRVQVDWVAANIGQTGVGQSAPLSSDTGSFWFFSSGNLELNIKVVDGRAVNGRFWVFFGALSDVAYTITVTDTQTGLQRTYTNPQGRLASVADTSAF